MKEIGTQINYWKEGAEDDFLTATLLIKNNRILHGLFFCHLTIEKILKAHIAKHSKDIPPKIHNLVRLLERTNLSLEEKDLELLEVLMIYLLEGRYPEQYPSVPSIDKANEILTETHKLLICLKQKL